MGTACETDSKWKPYPKYKDTGVEWLGEVPEHWDVKKFRRIARLKQGLQVAQANRFYEPAYNRYKYITIKSIHGGDNGIKEYIENPSESVICCPSDILLARTGATGEVISGQFGVFHNNFFKVDYDPNQVKKEYLIYYLLNSAIKEHLLLLAGTTTIPDLNHGEFLDTPFVSPLLPEQALIIKFLDANVSKIDALIAKKERLIELLQEKRAALISHAVTKGIDPSVSMKDSGVEWLGEIPAHWTVARLKSITSEITVGIVVTPSKYYVEEGVPCLRSLNVRELELLDTDLVFISHKSNNLLSKSMIFTGDLVSIRTGQPGTTAVITEKFDRSNCIDLIIIRRSQAFHSFFLAYLLNSKFAKTQYEKGSDGAIQQHFNIEMAKNLIVVLPPVREQESIAISLHHKLREINLLITTISDSIEKLKEYRNALISAAVTGKIDVRYEVHNGETA